jgi:hypothetical protein
MCAPSTIEAIDQTMAALGIMKTALEMVASRDARGAKTIHSIASVVDRDIRGMRTRRNTHTPLGGLPTEILVHLFEMLDHVRLTPMSRRTALVATVCSRFRAVALVVPHIWSFIDCRWPRHWIDLYLKHAASCQLYVQSPGDDRSDTVSLLCSLMSRLHTLDVHHREGRSIVKVLSARAPFLRDLTISTMHTLSTEAVPLNLLPGCTSVLTSLRLEEVIVDGHNFPSCPTLQHLFLIRCQLHMQPDFFSDIFQNTPGLVSFVLQDPIGSMDTSSSPSVMLPHLSQVNMFAPTRAIWLALQPMPVFRGRLVMCNTDDDGFDPLIPGDVSMIADIDRFAREFQRKMLAEQVSADAVLSVCVDVTGIPRGYTYTILTSNERDTPSTYLHLRLSHPLRSMMEPLLPATTRIEIFTRNKGESFGDAPINLVNWPLEGDLPALTEIDIDITHFETDSLIGTIRQWANRRPRSYYPNIIVTATAGTRAEVMWIIEGNGLVGMPSGSTSVIPRVESA